MCGIAGIISRAPLDPDAVERVSRMGETLIHRGPDGAGTIEAEQVAITMRRLSIIDLGTGWQPLYNEDRSISLVCNGEIYNYVELREKLRARGHRFQTGSDCETIAHLYEEYGDRCVEHLRGMFAIALWDSRRKRVLLARDRMGEKPLYLSERDGMLIFGSELKTMLSSGDVEFRIDPRAIDLYFHYQWVPEPLTPIAGVRKLPAAHVMTVDLDPWSVQERCYWRMEDAPPLDGDPARLIRAELETISEIVIRSDVPVGIALSGGLDSSAIAVLATRKYPEAMHAFSVGYETGGHTDERADARALAQHLGMPFHEVEVSAREMSEAFSDIIYWRDDPIADMSGYNYFAIARAARERNVPVLLQGQGGDELFWGYWFLHEAVRQSERKARRNGSVVSSLRDYLRLTLPKTRPRRAPLEWAVSLAGLRSSWDNFQRDRLSPRERLVFYNLTPEFQTASRQVSRLYSSRFQQSLGDSTPFDLFTLPQPWPALDILITRLICETYLLENGIAQGDRLSMASSVELRLPLVDYRLVETVIGLRKAHSDLGLSPKAWFRQAIQDVVPEWVRKRPKRGFQPPVRAWNRALFERHGHLLNDGMLAQLGILEGDACRRLAQGPIALLEGVPLSFRALVLEVWCRRFSALAKSTASTSLQPLS